MGCICDQERVVNMIVTKVDGDGKNPVHVHTFLDVQRVFNFEIVTPMNLRRGMAELYESYIMEKSKEHYAEKFSLAHAELIDTATEKSKIYWAWIDEEDYGGPYKKYEVNNKLFQNPLRRSRIRCLELLLMVK